MLWLYLGACLVFPVRCFSLFIALLPRWCSDIVKGMLQRTAQCPPPLPTKLLSACVDALYVNTAIQDLLSIYFMPNLALAARLSSNEKNRQNPCLPFITNLSD